MSSNSPSMPSHHRRRSSNPPAGSISESQLLPPRPTQLRVPATAQQSNDSSSSSRSASPEPDPQTDLPLSMSTSLLLQSPTLPSDARTALSQLATTLDPPTLKVAIRFHAIGSAPQLKQKVFKISASSKFGNVVAFLRKKLYGSTPGPDSGGGGVGQGLFCYVNSVFAPGLDEGVGNLWRCFKTDDQLIVGYSVTPAFG